MYSKPVDIIQVLLLERATYRFDITSINRLESLIMPKFICSILVAYLLVSVLCLGRLDAQQEQFKKPDFGEGELEDVSGRMEKLLKLKWDGKNITLARKWDEKKEKPKDKEEELKQVVEELVDRGIPKAQAEEFARQMMERGRRGLRGIGRFGLDADQSPVEKAFFRVPNALGGRSQGSSGDGARRRLSFSDSKISGNAVLSNDDVRFSFEENTDAERSFELRDNGDGAVNFSFTHGELFVRLRQGENGKTQLIWINQDQANVYVGETFTQFIQKNPQVTKHALFPLFDRLGIEMPIDKSDPRVVAGIVDKIKQEKMGDDEALKKLINELDSDSYEIRKKASKKLTDGYEQWASKITKYLTDSSLSPEAQVRLKEIIAGGTENELDKFISEQKLMDSTEYLVSLLSIVGGDDKQLIVEHLEQLTGQSHGDDSAAWEKWLESADNK